MTFVVSLCHGATSSVSGVMGSPSLAPKLRKRFLAACSSGTITGTGTSATVTRTTSTVSSTTSTSTFNDTCGFSILALQDRKGAEVVVVSHVLGPPRLQKGHGNEARTCNLRSKAVSAPVAGAPKTHKPMSYDGCNVVSAEAAGGY